MKGGVIIIGSLLWDNNLYEREVWWEKLDFNNKVKVLLPIRYGRSSSANRKNTYSMVFSTILEDTNRLGSGYFIPFKNDISTEKEFIAEIKQFGKVEGFKGNRIAANWGAVCLKINPKTNNFEFLTEKWNNIVAENINSKKPNQTIPNLNNFGENAERKSITKNWMFGKQSRKIKFSNPLLMPEAWYLIPIFLTTILPESIIGKKVFGGKAISINTQIGQIKLLIRYQIMDP